VQADGDLIDEVLAGNRGAYADLVRRYERHVHAAAWGVLRDHHTAQDVTQETFIKAYEKLGALRKRHTFGVWILKIARRRAIDLARGKKRFVFVSVMPDIPTPEVFAKEDAARILAAMARLPEREQQVLLFRYFNDLSMADIAATLGRPVGTITKRLSRALVRLRDRLKETL
jgi:RNA polymerase sigma-70 factor (ECF subfamily)